MYTLKTFSYDQGWQNPQKANHIYEIIDGQERIVIYRVDAQQQKES